MKDAAWLRGLRVAVIGLGITGKACARALTGLGAEAVVTDTRADLTPFAAAIQDIRATGARFEAPDAAFDSDPQLVIVSPGLALEHDLVQRFLARGTPVISEIELAFRLAEGTCVAVTGTNGKTTTTGLAGHVLAAKFPDVRVVGNIGDPLIGAVEDSAPDTVFVIEVSSFQLETCDTLRPRVGAVLNIQPDHLERHRTMEAYAAAKRRLIERQQAGDTAVLNADDPMVRAMAAHTRADTLYVSTAAEVEQGGFVRGGALRIHLHNKVFDLIDIREMSLKGEHNQCNALCAALCGLALGVSADQTAERLRTFRGYPHRIQTVGVKNGIEFVDDSKGTNPDAVLAALRAFTGRPLALILGGDDKGLDYTDLYAAVRGAARHVVVLGPGLRRMARELEDSGHGSVATADSMDEAVRAAAGQIGPGGVVLLSPASSSFDLFKNYAERGRAFQHAVETL